MTSPGLRLGCAGVGVAALALTLSLAGCGLIDPDVTNFDLALPDKRFSIDARGWQVDPAAAETYFGTSCDGMPAACSAAVEAACPMGCSGACNASARCELSLDISVVQQVDLLTEKPELKSIDDEPVVKVSIDSVTYEVTSNDLSVATPELMIYVAPASVVRYMPDDPQIKRIGSIAPLAARATTSGPQPVAFTPTGQAQLIDVMRSFKTPFNILVGAALRIDSADDLPTGKLDAVVRIRAHAGL